MPIRDFPIVGTEDAMSRIEKKFVTQYPAPTPASLGVPPCEATLLVVEGDPALSGLIGELCSFLGVEVAQVKGTENLGAILGMRRPMAVVTRMDGTHQDGCHVMKVVSAHDTGLPIMVLTDGDAALAGAADAIEEILGLTAVDKRSTPPGAGELVEFLFRAGQRGRCLGLMPA